MVYKISTQIQQKVKELVAQLCLTLCSPMDCSLPGSSVLGIPGKNTGVGCHSCLQGIFSTQRSNPGLLHCRQIAYHLSHQGNPKLKKSVETQSHHCFIVLTH